MGTSNGEIAGRLAPDFANLENNDRRSELLRHRKVSKLPRRARVRADSTFRRDRRVVAATPYSLFVAPANPSSARARNPGERSDSAPCDCIGNRTPGGSRESLAKDAL